MIKIVLYNLNMIFKIAIKVATTFFSCLTIVLSFVTWEQIIAQGFPNKLWSFVLIVIISVSLSILWVAVIKNKVIIYEKGTNRISVCYGDVLKIGFSKRNMSRRIVVIPVNTSFDTILDEDITENRKPLISIETIHGKWLLKMKEEGKDTLLLDLEINEHLHDKVAVKTLTRNEKTRGRLEHYDIGTVISIQGSNRCTFLLVALSEFDENNNSISSKSGVIRCAEAILNYYEMYGQGYDLYIPLIGTGRSGAELSLEESVRILKSYFLLHTEQVRGKVNIVIYQKQKHQISIFD